MSNRFSPNWKLILLLLIPIWSVVVFSVWAITRPVVDVIVRNTDHAASINFMSIILAALFPVAGIVVSWGAISGFLTEITETGITKSTLSGRKTIYFSDVEEIKLSGYRLRLRDRNRTLSLSLAFYKDPQAVLSFIQGRLPRALMGSERSRPEQE